MNLKHSKCGTDLSIAVLTHDVAHYVWCETCRDLVEEGEIDPPIDLTVVRLHVDGHRVRLSNGDAGGLTLESIREDEIPPDGWITKLRALFGINDSATWQDIEIELQQSKRLAQRYVDDYSKRQENKS